MTLLRAGPPTFLDICFWWACARSELVPPYFEKGDRPVRRWPCLRIIGDRRLAFTGDLPPGVFAFACRNGANGRVGLALANYGLTQHQTRRLTLSVTGLNAGPWKLPRWQVDEKHSSRWDLAEDRPEGAAQNDLQVLEARTMSIDNTGKAQLELDLPRWSSLFIALEPAP